MSTNSQFVQFSRAAGSYGNQTPREQLQGDDRLQAMGYGRAKTEQQSLGIGCAAVVDQIPYTNCPDVLAFEHDGPTAPMRNEWDRRVAYPLSKRRRVENDEKDGYVSYGPLDINTDGLTTIRHLGAAGRTTTDRQQQAGSNDTRPSRQVNTQGINEILQRVNSGAARSSTGNKKELGAFEAPLQLPCSDFPPEFSREFGRGRPPRNAPAEVHHRLEIPDFAAALPTVTEGAELRPNSRVRDEGWPLQGISAKEFGSLGAANNASCMEKLLVQCATALEMNDVTLAQQIMWVLNNLADPDGDTNQRVTFHFLKALVSRAHKMGSNLLGEPPAPHVSKFVSPRDLAAQVDVTPWYRFGYCAANGALVEAFEGKGKVHIIDFSTTHCMQWPTLIEALGDRAEGPPHLRLTVHQSSVQVPPILESPYHELGERLLKFAKVKNVPLEFRVITGQAEALETSVLGLQEGEVVAVNCMMRVHYIPDESADVACPRDKFLRMIKSLNPAIVTLVEEDSNLTPPSLVSRLKVAFNYLWIPFDALDTFLPRHSSQRLQYEGDIGLKIDNVIACEGLDRIERLESKEKWMQRMKKAGFEWTPFNQDVVAEVKHMLDDHAAGWGLKKEEDSLSLTWKGHNVVFATAWVPV